MSYFEEDADGNGIPDYAELADQKGVQIVTLAFGNEKLGQTSEGHDELKRISKLTGGQYYYCSIVPNGDEFAKQTLQEQVNEIKSSTKKAVSDKTPDGVVGECGFSDSQLKQMFDKDADNPAKLGDGTLVRSIMKDDDDKTVSKDKFKKEGKDYDHDGLNNNKELVIERSREKYVWILKSNPVKWDTDKDGINDKEDYKPFEPNPVLKPYEEDTPKVVQIGFGRDYANKVNGNPTVRYIYVFTNDSSYGYKVDSFKKMFDNNGEYSKDILVIDTSDANHVNYQVYNSYKYSDRTLIEEVVTAIKNYNDITLGRSDRWSRTVDSMINEWYGHNILYNITTGELEEQAKHVDLDDNADPRLMNWFK